VVYCCIIIIDQSNIDYIALLNLFVQTHIERRLVSWDLVTEMARGVLSETLCFSISFPQSDSHLVKSTWPVLHPLRSHLHHYLWIGLFSNFHNWHRFVLFYVRSYFKLIIGERNESKLWELVKILTLEVECEIYYTLRSLTSTCLGENIVEYFWTVGIREAS
jgi:hypothetical protein